MPKIAVLMASVALQQKTTREESRTLKNAESFSRTSKIARLARRPSAWVDRPGLAPMRDMKSTIAAGTTSGFGNDVAALSQ
jgi:hypothetical protein